MNTCRNCGDTLVPFVNWTASWVKTDNRTCAECNRKRALSRRVHMVMPDGSTRDCLWQHRKRHIDNCVSYERYTVGDTSVITATKPQTQKLKHPELDRIRRERKAKYSSLDEEDERARDGFVYIIEIPGQEYLKIGHARDPMQRVKSVKSFLVEDPIIRHMVYTDDRMRDEKAVHTALETWRHKSNKELFDCGFDLAKEVVDDHVGIRPGSGQPVTSSDSDTPVDNSRGGWWGLETFQLQP